MIFILGSRAINKSYYCLPGHQCSWTSQGHHKQSSPQLVSPSKHTCTHTPACILTFQRSPAITLHSSLFVTSPHHGARLPSSPLGALLHPPAPLRDSPPDLLDHGHLSSLASPPHPGATAAVLPHSTAVISTDKGPPRTRWTEP